MLLDCRPGRQGCRAYFTAEEQAWIAPSGHPARAFQTALVWSAKESALKAARVGLRRDTRAVHVNVPGPDSAQTAPETWVPLEVHDRADGRAYRGFWCLVGPDLVLTMVGHPAIPEPTAVL